MVGQILVYRYNNLINAKENVDRDLFYLKDVPSSDLFKHMIEESLDEFPPGKGYILARWSGKTFLCEKDPNNPNIPYIRHQVNYHPLLSKFTI
jgi:hypothetical protein